MSNVLPVPTREEVHAKTRETFDHMKKAMGMVPNIYAIIGHSENALESYLAFSTAQGRGSFNAREREAIFLAVSEINGCNYCLAAHTALAKNNGFSEEEIEAIRAGEHKDKKLRTIIRLAQSIVRFRGKAEEPLIAEFFALGYSKGALVDLVALVIDKTFTNFIGRLSQAPIDFPAVKPLAKTTPAQPAQTGR